jgi:hypothetical protein
MSSLPRVTQSTRERIAREFDNLGPRACVAEISATLRLGNPEILDVATRCASDTGDPEAAIAGFAMLYRLLAAEAYVTAAAEAQPPPPSSAALRLDPLPYVMPDTRERVVRQIHEKGAETFMHDALGDMERSNPELLQMAHHFASWQRNYLAAMQGLALIYACLAAQAETDHAAYH